MLFSQKQAKRIYEIERENGKETDLGLVLKFLTGSVGCLFLGHSGSLAPQCKPLVSSLILPLQPRRRKVLSETILWHKRSCEIKTLFLLLFLSKNEEDERS